MAYIGSAEDSRRIRKQEEEREKQRKEFEERKKQGESNIDNAGLRQFGAGSTEVLEAAFKNETIGLVTREEFLNKRNTLEKRLEEEATKKKRDAEQLAAAQRAERQRKKARTEAKSKLSFLEDEEQEDTAEESANAKVEPANENILKLRKDPNAETSFLPDRDREQQEEDMRRQIQQEYELRQQILRNEDLEITYSYWEGGKGHRRVLTAKRGNTIGEFLKQVREQLSPEFKEVRNISLTSLMYVKEDTIIPHDVTFHALIKKKAQGKTGPLFDFGVHEDVRAHSDARVEKTDSHAGKVVTRSSYDRNKHIFPASKWEMLPENF